MKRFLQFSLLTALALGLVSTSCSVDSGEETGDDIIWDFSPLIISVKVLDANGYSILYPYTANNISATYKGETYQCHKDGMVTDSKAQVTRYYIPHFFGLTYQTDYLLFGELDSDRTYTDEQLIIHWEPTDSIKPDTITFSHRITWNKNTPLFQQSFYLNGKAVEGQIVIQKNLDATTSLPDNTPRRTIDISDEQHFQIQTLNTFSFNLYNKLLAQADGKSTIASPLSIAYILGMLASGANPDSETWQQIMHVLQGGNGADKSLIPAAASFTPLFQTLIHEMPSLDTQVTLQIANALFANRRPEPLFYSGYVNLLASMFQADTDELDFGDPASVNIINEWCNQKTHGMIPVILNEVNPDAVAYLLDAIHFKGGWRLPFKPEDTETADFYTTDGRQVGSQQHFMHQSVPIFYARANDFAAIRLPFSKEAFEMMILLPDEEKSPEQVLSSITAQNPDALSWELNQVDLRVPRFGTESTHDKLIYELKDLGITHAFSGSAEFTEMSPQNLYVTNMLQKARIAVDEKGCEAAAVTVAELMEGSFGPNDLCHATFTANRPFLYLIRETSSGAILFIGAYYGEPSR